MKDESIEGFLSVKYIVNVPIFKVDEDGDIIEPKTYFNEKFISNHRLDILNLEMTKEVRKWLEILGIEIVDVGFKGIRGQTPEESQPIMDKLSEIIKTEDNKPITFTWDMDLWRK